MILLLLKQKNYKLNKRTKNSPSNTLIPIEACSGLQLFGTARRALKTYAAARRNNQNENEIKDTTQPDNRSDTGSYVLPVNKRKTTRDNNQYQTTPPQNQRTFDQNPNYNTPRHQNRKSKRCCPYDFDSKICKVVDDRLLCGFNKNVGQPKSNNTVKHMHGDCKLRGGRIECGYDYWPYGRDPSIATHPPPLYHSTDPNVPIHTIPTHVPETYYPKEPEVQVTTSYPELVTQCVEVDNRIVCRKISN